jgi:hypothetical protein
VYSVRLLQAIADELAAVTVIESRRYVVAPSAHEGMLILSSVHSRAWLHDGCAFIAHIGPPESLFFYLCRKLQSL